MEVMLIVAALRSWLKKIMCVKLLIQCLIQKLREGQVLLLHYRPWNTPESRVLAISPCSHSPQASKERLPLSLPYSPVRLPLMPVRMVQGQKVQWVLPPEVTRRQGFVALQDSNPVLGNRTAPLQWGGGGLSRPSVTKGSTNHHQLLESRLPWHPEESTQVLRLHQSKMGVCLQGLVSWGLLNNTLKTQLTWLLILLSDTRRLLRALESFLQTIKYLHPLVKSFTSEVLLPGFLCLDAVPAFCIFSLERRVGRRKQAVLVRSGS